MDMQDVEEFNGRLIPKLVRSLAAQATEGVTVLPPEEFFAAFQELTKLYQTRPWTDGYRIGAQMATECGLLVLTPGRRDVRS